MPVLVCEDDCGFELHCHNGKNQEGTGYCIPGTVWGAEFGKSGFRMEKQSGIPCLEAYSDQDWEEYGDNIACEQFDSPEYRNGCRNIGMKN